MPSSTGFPKLFRFTGEQWDATGFEYLRARYYDPGLGRLIAADTVQPNAEGTQGWNLYAYVANNPATWVDPTGHVAAGAIPTAPTAGGATDSLAPYMAGAMAAGPLAALGLKIADNLTYLALVFAGAWTLVDIWQTVQEDGDSRPECAAKAAEELAQCKEAYPYLPGSSNRARTRRENFLRCKSVVDQNTANCRSGIPVRHPLPLEYGDDDRVYGGVNGY